MNTYLHSGDLGDLLAACAYMNHEKEGILYLIDNPITKRFTADRFNTIVPLLRAQPYLKHVDWFPRGAQVSHDFINFRRVYGYGEDLASMQARYFNLHSLNLKDPWLFLPEKIEYDPHGPVLINRSVRYHSNKFPWRKVLEFFGDDIKFQGDHEDWRQFCNEM